MVKLLAEYAPAKINLCLRVTGRRADGYHELDSIFIPITWCDMVRLEARPSVDARVTLRCNDPALADGDSNLASRAAAAFMRENGISAEVLIDLRKSIPMGAGLGGGSSDAGAVLRMMAALFGKPVDARLAEVAVQLGADVPFFLDPRPARVRGIGEKVEPLASMPDLHLVVAAPNFPVPTARIFAALKQENWSGPVTDADLRAFASGEISTSAMVNDLAAPAMQLFPQIAALKALLEESGARVAAMSGSGGAVFGIYPDDASTYSAVDFVTSCASDARIQAANTMKSSAAAGILQP